MKYLRLFESFDDKKEVEQKLLSFARIKSTLEYIINDDLSVEFFGDLQFNNYFKNCKQLPIKFSKVHGDIYFTDLGLETLEGLPNYVDGDLHIDNNKIHNLENLPSIVTGKIYCNDNPNLYSLKGCTDIKSINKFYRTPIAKLLNKLMENLPGFDLYDLIYRLEEFEVINDDTISINSLKSMIEFHYNEISIPSVQKFLNILDYNLEDIDLLGTFNPYKLVN